MASFNVLAGDLKVGLWFLETEGLLNPVPKALATGLWSRVAISVEEIASLVAVDDETSGGGFGVGRALVGGVLLGGVGAVVGGMTTKTKREITFECALKDGRRFLAKTSGKDWPLFQIIAFNLSNAKTPSVSASEVRSPNDLPSRQTEIDPLPEWTARAVESFSQPHRRQGHKDNSSPVFGRRKT